jgi:hypothetical protein
VKEHHYAVKELAEMWHRSEGYIRKHFRNEPGVVHNPDAGLFGRRSWDDFRIPESVALRVYQRHQVAPVKATVSRKQLRVVKFDRKKFAA